eukprot:6186009-Pleurochrysis_carterae.AAC.1
MGKQLGNVLGLKRLGAVEDVAVAVVNLEQLCADLELVGLVQRRADLLDVHLARDVEQLLLNVRYLAVDDLVRHLAAVGPQLDANKARKDQEEGRHLVARDVRACDGLSDDEVDGEGEAVTVEVFLALLRDALELGDLVAQPLVLCLQLLHLGGHGLHVEELAVQAHLIVR